MEPPFIDHYRKYPSPRIVTNIIEKTICKAENSNDVFNPSPMLLVRKTNILLRKVTALNKTVGFECGLSSNDLPVMYFVRGLLSKESVSDFSFIKFTLV